MTFVVALIYAGTVLLCLGTTAWIVRAWTQRRNWHKTPSDLHYIAVGAALLVSAGIGIKNKKMPGLGPSATTRREPEMKTGAAVLPFSFSDLDARVNPEWRKPTPHSRRIRWSID